jgi:hypothetical protein
MLARRLNSIQTTTTIAITIATHWFTVCLHVREEYIKERMKNVVPDLEEPSIASTTAQPLNTDELLFQTPDHHKFESVSNAEEVATASGVGQLVNGVVEVELPIEYEPQTDQHQVVE